MIDHVSVTYFEAREHAMREVGLDPDNDDEWAMPDFDFGRRIEIDEFIFGPAEDYDNDAWPMCRDCFSEFIPPGEFLCAICIHDRKRKGLAV